MIAFSVARPSSVLLWRLRKDNDWFDCARFCQRAIGARKLIERNQFGSEFCRGYDSISDKLERNARIRQGLERDLTDTEVFAWLKLL